MELFMSELYELFSFKWDGRTIDHECWAAKDVKGAYLRQAAPIIRPHKLSKTTENSE